MTKDLDFKTIIPMLGIDEKCLTATQIANFDGCARRKLQNSFQIRFNSCEFCEIRLFLLKLDFFLINLVENDELLRIIQNVKLC